IWDLTTHTHTATFTTDVFTTSTPHTGNLDGVAALFAALADGGGEDHTGSVKAIAVTDLNGRPHALTTSGNRTVRVWDLTTHTLTATLTGHTSSVSAIAVTHLDGRPHALTTSN
ncbi:hypothetical protein GTW71_20830, partial [Streptomyces sp. SID6041]|nr:hypothetical protein [Streptomyces sp. SID6041]